MRNVAATYASSFNTNMSAYKDLPGHHLFSICNLIASSPDDSYPDTAGTIADDINFFMENFMASEWDYSGVRNLNAFRSFQLAANYYLTCSEDSSEGDYDPTRECYMVELADGVVDEASSDGGNNEEPRPANQAVVPVATPAASSSSAVRRAQLAQLTELEKGSKRSNGRHDCYAPRSSRNALHTVRAPERRGVSPRSGSWPTTTSTTCWT
jgi:hypothetical protein